MIALNGFENDACVPAVDFEYPEDGDAEPVVTRDRWTDAPLYEKCQRRFAVVPRDRDETLPMLEMRLTVLRDAIREAAARTDFTAVARLSLKAQSTTRRIEAETLCYGHPGGSERHGDVLIVDDAGLRADCGSKSIRGCRRVQDLAGEERAFPSPSRRVAQVAGEHVPVHRGDDGQNDAAGSG